MTFPAACEHAMSVIAVHFSQMLVYQKDLEAYIAIVNADNARLKQQSIED